MRTDSIKTPCGEIVGLARQFDNAFLGIRYASARRFSMPEITDGWDGTYEATSFGACCPQQRAYVDESKAKNTFYYREFREGISFKYDEDCLFLNIYAPKQAENAPVIIFIHGGNFTRGSADEKPFDGEEYAKRGVIFITVNYRLNVFGFFADGDNANFGLYDQLAAVEWVRNNIRAFGGDPENITLMGQSAGAMSVQSLISSPLTEGKIKRAVMMSGGGVRKLILPEKEPDLKFWKSVMKRAGVHGTQEFLSLPTKEVFEAWQSSSPLSALFATAPVVDGKLITGRVKTDVPCIIGRVEKDMFPPELDAMARRYAKMMNESGTPCYIYDFTHALGEDATFHSADLWFAIGSLGHSSRKFVAFDYAVAREMVDRIAAFVRSGDPNVNGYPAIWRRYVGKKDVFKFE